MSEGAGIAMIVTGVGVAGLVMFGLWHRLPSSLAQGLVALAGAVIGAGGLLVQDGVGAASWAVTLIAFAVLTPVHTRLVFGPAGPSDGTMVAAGPSAA